MIATKPNPQGLPVILYGGPTKRLFVSMLTRDIELEDAILDLLDNSVDGAIRTTTKSPLSKNPYVGFRARLTLTNEHFALTDNCGGIPDDRIEAAFRLGRPMLTLDKDIPTIGMYGIGMKRAIFKIGKEAEVESSSSDGVRRISYSKAWLDDSSEASDQEWNLPIHYSKPRQEKGVKVLIPTLREDVARQFSNDFFPRRIEAQDWHPFWLPNQREASKFLSIVRR